MAPLTDQSMETVMPARPIVTQALLVFMLVVFGMQELWPERMLAWFGLWPDVGPIRVGIVDGAPVIAEFETWQFLSHGFLHGGLAHLLMNGLALYMFGSLLEQIWGGLRYLVFFLVCVIGGGLMQAWWVGTPSGNEVSVTLGASGGVFGILAAFAVLFPRHKVMLLIPPIPVPMPVWVLVLLFAVVSTVLGVTGLAVGIAHFAHLGGLITGLLMYLVVARSWWQPNRIRPGR